VLAGWEFGPNALDPYAQFWQLKPVDVIDHTVFVFDGHFEIPLASALGHAQSAAALLAENGFASVGQHVGQADAAVLTHLMIGHLALFQQLDQVGLRDIQQLGSFLGG
jgi:hypothetical protein